MSLKLPPVFSADRLGAGSSRRESGNTHFYWELEKAVVRKIKAALRSTDQDDHDIKVKCFRAANSNPAFHGPYLMVAVLYKLPVNIHQDVKDYRLTCMVCAGRFTGGWLQIPQFGINLL